MNKKVLFVIVFIVAIFGIVTVYIVRQALLFSEAMGCKDEILSDIQAENKEYSAYLISRQCGATAPNTFQVFVLPSQSELDFESNAPVLVKEGDTKPYLVWIGNEQLKIHLDNNSSIHRQEAVSQGIQILYEFSLPGTLENHVRDLQ